MELPLVPVAPWRLYLYFLRLGATGFGGPIALAGFMQRDLVEQRRWISREDYLDGLALAQLAPGRWPRNSRCTWAMCTEAWRARRWCRSRSSCRRS